MPILAKAPDTVFDWQSESLTQAYPSLPFHSLSFLSVAFLKTKAVRIKWSISQISVKTLNFSIIPLLSKHGILCMFVDMYQKGIHHFEQAYCYYMNFMLVWP